MLTNSLTYITGFSAIYCWLVAGIFLAFSDFIMKSLGVLPPATGIEAMQSINILVYRSIFMVGLMGLSIVSVLFIATDLSQGRLSYRGLAAVIYLIGVMAVTRIGNIPLNEELAAANPTSFAAQELWDRYLKVWVNWNHIRTLSSALAATLMTLAFFQTS